MVIFWSKMNLSVQGLRGVFLVTKSVSFLWWGTDFHLWKSFQSRLLRRLKFIGPSKALTGCDNAMFILHRSQCNDFHSWRDWFKCCDLNMGLCECRIYLIPILKQDKLCTQHCNWNFRVVIRFFGNMIV